MCPCRTAGLFPPIDQLRCNFKDLPLSTRQQNSLSPRCPHRAENGHSSGEQRNSGQRRPNAPNKHSEIYKPGHTGWYADCVRQTRCRMTPMAWVALLHTSTLRLNASECIAGSIRQFIVKSHPSEASLINHCPIAALDKGLPVSMDCTWYGRLGGALHPSIQGRQPPCR